MRLNRVFIASIGLSALLLLVFLNSATRMLGKQIPLLPSLLHAGGFDHYWSVYSRYPRHYEFRDISVSLAESGSSEIAETLFDEPLPWSIGGLRREHYLLMRFQNGASDPFVQDYVRRWGAARGLPANTTIEAKVDIRRLNEGVEVKINRSILFSFEI